MRYLGIDYGTKRIGLALSDEQGTMAFPKGVIDTSENVIEDVASLIRAEDVGTVVVGESVDNAGTPNPVMKKITMFVERLHAEVGIPVLLEPEFMTSTEAARAPTKETKSRSPKSRPILDASAATLILNSYLAKLKHHGRKN